MVNNPRSRPHRLASIFPLLLLLAVIQRVDGLSAVYDGNAGCKGYGFHMNAFWLNCTYDEANGLCALEDGAMRVQGTFSTEYMMPYAFYTVKIKACKWYGMRCIDVGQQFEVDLCEYIDCRIGNHTVDTNITFYGEAAQQYDYWLHHYGYYANATEEERYEYGRRKYYGETDPPEETEPPTEPEETMAPTEYNASIELDYRYGKTKKNNWFRNKYTYKRQQRQQEYQERYPERNISTDLRQFVSAGTVVTLTFTFIPYTDASYDMKWGWNTNKTAQGYYHQNYGKQYRYDNLVCSLPMKIVSDDFDIQLWKKSSKYRSRLRTYEKATTVTTIAIVGLLGLSVWGMKKRQLSCRPSACVCLDDRVSDDSSIRDYDAKATHFILDESDAHSMKIV